MSLSSYAIIRAGGRQHRAEPGVELSVDYRSIKPGEKIVFDEVLFVSRGNGEFSVGTPNLPNTRVIGVSQGDEQGQKIRVFKKKRRIGMRRTTGHRSLLTRVKITDIETG